MNIGMMVRFSRFPCTWMGEFGNFNEGYGWLLGKENGIGELDLYEREIEGMWQ